MTRLRRKSEASAAVTSQLAFAEARARGFESRRRLCRTDPDLLYTFAGNREDKALPLYLTRFSYTPETWAKLIKNPEDRREAARQYIESVGGKLHGFWYSFGDQDGYNLWEAPDNVSMAATALAIGAGGALASIQTTVLLSVEETLEALERASSIRYRPPGENRPTPAGP